MLETSIQGKDNRFSVDSVGLIDLTELAAGFTPAFRNIINNETHLSTTDEGSIAPEHRFDNLPIEWIFEWAEDGYAKSLLPTIAAGYIRGDKFYTLPELIKMPLDA